MPATDFTIRPFVETDRSALIALWEQCNLIGAWNDASFDIDSFVKTPTAEVFVGETAGRLVASIVIGHDGHRGWIYYLAVNSNHRNKDYGLWLLRHSEDWLRDQDIPKIQLLIRSENLDVKAFYARSGYHFNDCHCMQRWLDSRELIEPPGLRPDGRLEMLLTYLEMTAPPHLPPSTLPRGAKVALLRANPPSISFYRYLYETVGGPWLWYERRALSDETLKTIIEDEAVEIYVLYVDGTPAGFAELDRRDPLELELALFGLVPDYVGKGLGRYLLNWIIERAWSYEPKRLWVCTNQLDHRRALQVYQKSGFRPYRQERKMVDDPRLSGLLETKIRCN